MFVKTLISQSAARAVTDQEYKEVIKKRLLIYYILSMLGVITIACSLIFSSNKFDYLSDFMSGVYSGVGFGLLGVSIIFIFKFKKVLKNDKLIKQHRVEENDERVQMIMQKSLNSAASVLMVLMYIALMVAGIFNMVIFWTLWVLVMTYLVIYAGIYFYYKRTL